MSSQVNFSKDFKPSFSGHETFALRYGWLEKSFQATVSSKENPFISEDSIAQFGVGRNMVSAIKHWAIATGFLINAENELKVSDYARSLMDISKDPFLENTNSIWKIHYELVKNPKNTTLHYLFCYLNENVFDRTLLASRILDFLETQELKLPAEKTLSSDINVSISTYSTNSKTGPRDDDVNSPLSELNLIRNVGNNRFAFNFGIKNTLSNNLFLSCLADYWGEEERHSGGNLTSIKFEDILHSPRSPGRIFLLSEKELVNRLSSIEEVSNGQIIWSETAGIQQLSKTQRYKAHKLLEKWSCDYE